MQSRDCTLSCISAVFFLKWTRRVWVECALVHACVIMARTKLLTEASDAGRKLIQAAFCQQAHRLPRILWEDHG